MQPLVHSAFAPAARRAAAGALAGLAITCAPLVHAQPAPKDPAPAVAPPAQTPPPAEPPAPVAPLPPIPFPHPVIMEVLFAVPRGMDGDANKDGTRDATGDEFIELMNPHDKPIELGGYTLSDRNEEPDRQIHFVFPQCSLAPGQIAVVFNGHKAKIRGPVGDSTHAPEAGNPNFSGALVFTMKIDTKYRALSNTADFILLSDRESKPIHAVTWGDANPAPPKETFRIDVVNAQAFGSAQRLEPNGPMMDHAEIDATLFSPGVIPKKTN